MPKLLPGFGLNAHRVVISLCDYSGNWPMSWWERGHTVLCYDLKHGDDVTTLSPGAVHLDCHDAMKEALDWSSRDGWKIVAVLASPP